MQILSWNIQNGKGCDGIVALDNTVDIIKKTVDADVICLQEVARNFEQHGTLDQLHYLEQAFPEYTSVWAPGLSWPLTDNRLINDINISGFNQKSARREFGNLVLVKHNLLLDFKLHTLPSPPVNGLMQMPRTAIEVIVEHAGQSIRVLSTHLAFHSQPERIAQLDYLTALKNLAKERSSAPADPNQSGCYSPRPSPAETILCGDLNIALESEEYQHLLNAQWHDAWTMLYPDLKHLPTCGIYDHEQWPQGAHCRDYFLCSSSINPRLHQLQVDTTTSASDHQPICLTIKACP